MNPDETALDLLRAFPRLSVTVWGDLVADEFLAGEIARVSREAPVLILKQRSRAIVPGGAANAAMNLAALGVRVTVIGAVGEDESGASLRAALTAAGVDTSGIAVVPKWTTPTKTRILAHHAHTAPQQVVRVDREPARLPPAVEKRLAKAAQRAGARSAAVLLSDYGYGALSPGPAQALRAALGGQALIAVDARFNIAAYVGMTAATPNEAEVEAALGLSIGRDESALERAGRALRAKLRCEHLLITRGRDGMALFEPRRPTLRLAVHGSDQALDVTGAGDTVIAVFTVALAAAAGRDHAAAIAARLANRAAAIVVMKPGTATCSAAELARALQVR